MKKILGAAAAALLTVTVLAGCGGGSDSSNAGSTGSSGSGNYCDDIKSTAASLKALNGNVFARDKFSQLNAAVHSIASEAPSDIQSSWTLIASEFDALQKTITDAGLSMSDLAKMSSGQMPAGFDASKLKDLTTQLNKFDTSGVTAASKKISAQVKSDCGIDINSASS